MNTRTEQIRIALAVVIGLALVDRCFTHLLNVTPAGLIAAALIAVTLAAGQRPGAVIQAGAAVVDLDGGLPRRSARSAPSRRRAVCNASSPSCSPAFSRKRLTGSSRARRSRASNPRRLSRHPMTAP